MNNSVQSAMMTELTPSSERLLRHTVLCRICRWLSYFLVPICFLAQAFAIVAISSIPFQVFNSYHVSPFVYWPALILWGACIAWALWRAARWGVLSLRRCVISLDAMLIFVGLLVGVLASAWLFPPK